MNFLNYLTLPLFAVIATASYASTKEPNNQAHQQRSGQVCIEMTEQGESKVIGYHWTKEDLERYYSKKRSADTSSSRSSSDYDYSSSEGFRGHGGSALPRKIDPPGERVFIFSPRYKAWAAYMPDGRRVGYGRANGGSNWCSETGRPCRTPTGYHRVQSKGSPECKSSKYPLPKGGAPMPYCMYFRGGYAIHGSPYISDNNSSHGCIRVQTRAAYWLSNYFMKIGTKVLVKSY